MRLVLIDIDIFMDQEILPLRFSGFYAYRLSVNKQNRMTVNTTYDKIMLDVWTVISTLLTLTMAITSIFSLAMIYKEGPVTVKHKKRCNSCRCLHSAPTKCTSLRSVPLTLTGEQVAFDQDDSVIALCAMNKQMISNIFDHYGIGLIGAPVVHKMRKPSLSKRGFLALWIFHDAHLHAW